MGRSLPCHRHYDSNPVVCVYDFLVVYDYDRRLTRIKQLDIFSERAFLRVRTINKNTRESEVTQGLYRFALAVCVAEFAPTMKFAKMYKKYLPTNSSSHLPLYYY